MTQRHSNARQQFAAPERLLYIVVRTLIERRDFVFFTVPDGEDENWNLGPFAQALENR